MNEHIEIPDVYTSTVLLRGSRSDHVYFTRAYANVNRYGKEAITLIPIEDGRRFSIETSFKKFLMNVV